MIFISHHTTSDALLLGIGKHNQDKLFIYSELDFDGAPYFAENIFDFLFKCRIVEYHDDEYLYDKIRKVETKRLYKNWGEDFWRMRVQKLGRRYLANKRRRIS